MAKPRTHFLLGRAEWFGPGSLPVRLPHEMDAPESWDGWRRQRLRPTLARFLLPAAWSVFFFTAGLIPMLLHAAGYGIGMSTKLGIGLWLGGFGLLWLSSSMISSQQVEGSSLKMMAWNLIRIESILLGVLAWIVQGNPDGSITIIALLISIPLWLSHLVRISTILAWPAGRWLLPIAHVDIGLSSIDEKWIAESKRWARRPLARRHVKAGEMGDTRLEMILFGLRHENQDFIAVHLVHPCGAIIDPFVGAPVGQDITFSQLGPIFADVPSSPSIRSSFGSPPVTPVVAAWPSDLVPIWDSEEE